MHINCNLFFIFAFLLLLELTMASKYNVSIEDIEQYKCKEYTPQADYYTYTHETFFKLDNFTHSCKLGNDSVNLDLFIISTSSCSILLSTTDSPDYNEPALEIAIMYIEGDGFILYVRKSILGDSMVKKILPGDVLSAIQPLPLNVRVTNGGELILTINSSKEILANVTIGGDSLPINYVAFSNAGLEDSKYFFDCETDIYNGTDRGSQYSTSMLWIVFGVYIGMKYGIGH